MTVGGLFDGCGLLAYGLHLAGFEHVWLCEKDEFRRELLRLRFPGVPVYEDVADVDARATRPLLVAGGFPCKGVSAAGRREGFGHPETALWREMARVVRELRPRYVLVENVADLLALHGGELFGEVVGTLAESGFDCEWDCLPAAAFGAPHGRDRVFITAAANAERDCGQAASAGPDQELEDGNGRRSGDGGLAAAADARLLGRPARRGSGEGGPSEERGRRPPDRHGEAPADAEREPGQLHRGAGGLAAPLEAQSGAPERGRRELAAPAGGAETDWGPYAAAVERWEAILGRPAPQPLVRRVDDGRARRVERSRLSALGDGVLVQAGWFLGRRIADDFSARVT